MRLATSLPAPDGPSCEARARNDRSRPLDLTPTSINSARRPSSEEDQPHGFRARVHSNRRAVWPIPAGMKSDNLRGKHLAWLWPVPMTFDPCSLRSALWCFALERVELGLDDLELALRLLEELEEEDDCRSPSH